MADIRYISLGAGVQSSALLILSAAGKVSRADVAIFADTCDEPQWVYEHLEALEQWSSIPIERVSWGHLSADIIARHRGDKSRFAGITAFTRTGDGRSGPLRRQCTREYKIQPIERRVKELLGYRKGQRVKKKAVAMIGISFDELIRMKPSRTNWIDIEYPLVDLRLNRADCSAIVEDAGFAKPKKSSCVFCPYHSDSYWIDLRDNYKSEWERAVSFDREIRDMSRSGISHPVFLHRTLRPLNEVQFKHDGQGELFGEECDGHCGV